MGDRGRTSAAELTVLKGGIDAKTKRASAPDCLTEDQAKIWNHVVGGMPSDWFGPETESLLVQYCRHASNADRIAKLITNLEKAKKFDLDEYDRLLRMQDKQVRAQSSLATRLRITQQTKYDKSKSRKPSGPVKPWEND